MQSDIVCSCMAMWIAMYMVNSTLLNCRRNCSYCNNELPVEDLRYVKVLRYHCNAATVCAGNVQLAVVHANK